jgi:hypothetical protein
MNILQWLVVLLWLINLGLLIGYMAEQEVNGWVITALVGVALTGVIPPLFRLKDNAKREGCATFLHVISGVIGAAGSGLALGYAAQCGKKSYDNIELLIAAAIVNGLSGIVAHYAFIDKDKRDEIYKNKSLAYSLFFTERGGWYAIIGGISVFVSSLTFAWNANDAYKARDVGCDSKDHYSLYLISPVVHMVAMLLLLADQYFDLGILQYLNFVVMHVAAILSMFGLTLTRGWGGDWPIVLSVYLYIALAHLTVTTRGDRQLS